MKPKCPRCGVTGSHERVSTVMRAWFRCATCNLSGEPRCSHRGISSETDARCRGRRSRSARAKTNSTRHRSGSQVTGSLRTPSRMTPRDWNPSMPISAHRRPRCDAAATGGSAPVQRRSPAHGRMPMRRFFATSTRVAVPRPARSHRSTCWTSRPRCHHREAGRNRRLMPWSRDDPRPGSQATRVRGSKASISTNQGPRGRSRFSRHGWRRRCGDSRRCTQPSAGWRAVSVGTTRRITPS